MLEVLREDYVRTARAKGVFRKLIVRRHALRNALLPVITIIGIEFAFLMGGLVVTEQVFNLNGLGKLFVESISNHDYNMTQALVMLVVAHLRPHQPRRRHHLCVARSRAFATAAEGAPMAIRLRARLAPRRRRAAAAVAALHALAVLPRRTRSALPAGFVVFVMIFMAVFADFVTVYDPTRNNFGAMLEPPSADHWLGTDQFGRDLYTRIVYGARTALLVGFVSAFVGATIGLVLGVASAYFGGRFDLIFQRVMDVLMAFPLVILALAVVSIFGTGHSERHHRHHHSVHPALRARRAIERAAGARNALYRCGARLRLQSLPHRAAPHGAERDGALPHHDDGGRRPGDPDRGIAVLSRARRAGAGAGLGPDAARRRAGIRRERAMGRDLPRHRHLALRCSASTCSATPCAMRWIPSCGRSEALAVRSIELHWPRARSPYVTNVDNVAATARSIEFQ